MMLVIHKIVYHNQLIPDQANNSSNLPVKFYHELAILHEMLDYSHKQK